MGKLPWMKFFPSNYLADTRGLSLSAKGVWMDLICFLWESNPRGQITATIKTFSRMLGGTENEINDAFNEFMSRGVCLVERDNHGNVTVISRRITREEKERELARLRKKREREKENVTHPSRQITPERIEDRGQRIEDRIKEKQDEETKEPVDNPEKDALIKDQKEHLKKLCKILETSFKNFNPYQFIQKAINLKIQPEPIIKTLSRMIEDKAEIISPWPWAEHVLKVESQNYNEVDFQNTAAKDKTIFDEFLKDIKELHDKKKENQKKPQKPLDK